MKISYKIWVRINKKIQNIEHLKVFDPIVVLSCVICKFIFPYNIFLGKDSLGSFVAIRTFYHDQIYT